MPSSDSVLVVLGELVVDLRPVPEAGAGPLAADPPTRAEVTAAREAR